MPHDPEVVGSNPAGWWAFAFFLVFLSLINGVSLFSSLKKVHLYVINANLAGLPKSKQAQLTQIK